MNQHLVNCPNCGHEFSVEAAIQNNIRESLQKEFEEKAGKQSSELRKKMEEVEAQRRILEEQKESQDAFLKVEVAKKLKDAEVKIKREASEELAEKMKLLEGENKNKAEQLKGLRIKEADFEQRERVWTEKMESAELEMKRKLAEKEAELKLDAEKKAMEKAEVSFKEKEVELKRRQDELSLESEKKANEIAEKIRNDEGLKRAELQKQLDDQKKLVDEMKRKAEQGSMQLQGEV